MCMCAYVCVHVCICICVYGTFYEILTLVNVSIYSFQAVNAIDSHLHNALHHTISLCESVLHKHSADATRSDSSCGLKLPHLQVRVFKLLQIQCEH